MPDLETIDDPKPNVLITGASGMIASALAPRLEQAGYSVHKLSRTDMSAPFYFDPLAGRMRLNGDIPLNAVINLAGANIADRRWTPVQKEKILQSRRTTTLQLCETLAAMPKPPEVLLTASAIGYYGGQQHDPADESGAAGEDFLAKVSVEWEKATEPAIAAGIRTVVLRFGLVLDDSGGVIKNLVMPGGLMVVGRLGDGQHKMSWISLDDAIKVMLAALTNDQFSGALNVVAPQVVSNREFARALSKAKQRLAIPPIPATMVRLMFGEMADAALLASSNIQSSRMQELGVTLDYPDIDSALQKCFA
jgi:uncharacterized protein (TIGR01777 family)